MAAPNNAYNGRTLVDKKDNIIIHHQEANITDTIAILKERFYLDDVFLNQKDGVSGFIGCCYASTTNYNMHATNRLGSLAKYRETSSGNGNWQSYRLFNDSGLNTLPYVLLLEITDRRANIPKLKAIFKSSFYADSIIRGYESKLISANDWRSYDITPWNLPANQKITTTDSISTGYIKDDLVTFRAYIENEEGRYYSNQITVIMLPPVYSYGTEYRTSGCNSGVNVIIYMYETDFDNLDTLVTEVPSITGIKIWKDENFTIRADDGFYGRLSSSSKIFEVREGQVLSYQICPNPPTINDISIYLSERYVNDVPYFDIQIVKNKMMNYDIKVTGAILAYDIHGNSLSSSGLGNYSITILAGDETGTYSTSKPNNTGTSGIEYYMATVSTRQPSSLTYTVYRS